MVIQRFICRLLEDFLQDVLGIPRLREPGEPAQQGEACHAAEEVNRPLIERAFRPGLHEKTQAGKAVEQLGSDLALRTIIELLRKWKITPGSRLPLRTAR